MEEPDKPKLTEEWCPERWDRIHSMTRNYGRFAMCEFCGYADSREFLDWLVEYGEEGESYDEQEIE